MFLYLTKLLFNPGKVKPRRHARLSVPECSVNRMFAYTALDSGSSASPAIVIWRNYKLWQFVKEHFNDTFFLKIKSWYKLSCLKNKHLVLDRSARSFILSFYGSTAARCWRHLFLSVTRPRAAVAAHSLCGWLLWVVITVCSFNKHLAGVSGGHQRCGPTWWIGPAPLWHM